jgi:hypothetical protein
MATPREIDDATAEALVAGGTVADDLEPLVRLLRAYREAARQPVRPCPVLATRMATGGIQAPAPGHPAVNTVSGPVNGHGYRRPAVPVRRRPRTVVLALLAAGFTKIAGLSGLVKASAGLTIVVTGIGSAGVAGMLPDPVQQRFDSVVESVLPDDLPAETGGNADLDSGGEEPSEHAGRGGGGTRGPDPRPAQRQPPGGPPDPVEPGAAGDRHQPTPADLPFRTLRDGVRPGGTAPPPPDPPGRTPPQPPAPPVPAPP